MKSERERMITPEYPVRELEARLMPINRSLTGEGVRESLGVLRRYAEFETREIPSGTKIFGWTVPPEWNVREAFIESSNGRVVDFKTNNLHLVGYSTPLDRVLTFEELEPHIHTLPSKPRHIPYITSYYKPDWGFCMTEEQKKTLDKNAQYHVKIDSALNPEGSMTLGEGVLRGESDEEILISTYSCHPSMANDNLSGMITWALLNQELRGKKLHYTYRFIIGPETIGALTFLATHDTKKIKGALVINNNGGFDEEFTYKKTFLGDSELDRAMELTLKETKVRFSPRPFDVRGSDERQFSSPAFRIPSISLFKGKYYEYYDYHTSGDSRLNSQAVLDSIEIYKRVIEKLEWNETPVSNFQSGEPFLEQHGLYTSQIGKPTNFPVENWKNFKIGQPEYGGNTDAILWIMFYADGKHSMMDISEATGFPMKQLHEQALILKEKGLIK